jgi:hypothetical protein
MLSMLITVSNASDWLEGGYVGSGDYSEIRQHFTDPIFYSKSGSYTTSDAAVRQMQESMDRQSTVPLGSLAAASAAANKAVTSSQYGVAGNWRLELSDGNVIDLSLVQSGLRVFGRGSMTSSQGTLWTFASGTIAGSLQLDVVPATGTELYAITMDVNRLHLPGLYTAYGAYTTPKTGTVKASRVA